jgi:hypothetical protein
MERDRDRDRDRERERERETQRQGLWLAFGDFTAADPLLVQLLEWKKHLRGPLYLFDPCVSGGTGKKVIYKTFFTGDGQGQACKGTEMDFYNYNIARRVGPYAETLSATFSPVGVGVPETTARNVFVECIVIRAQSVKHSSDFDFE